MFVQKDMIPPLHKPHEFDEFLLFFTIKKYQTSSCSLFITCAFLVCVSKPKFGSEVRRSSVSCARERYV